MGLRTAKILQGIFTFMLAWYVFSVVGGWHWLLVVLIVVAAVLNVIDRVDGSRASTTGRPAMLLPARQTLRPGCLLLYRAADASGQAPRCFAEQAIAKEHA